MTDRPTPTAFGPFEAAAFAKKAERLLALFSPQPMVYWLRKHGKRFHVDFMKCGVIVSISVVQCGDEAAIRLIFDGHFDRAGGKVGSHNWL